MVVVVVVVAWSVVVVSGGLLIAVGIGVVRIVFVVRVVARASNKILLP